MLDADNPDQNQTAQPAAETPPAAPDQPEQPDQPAKKTATKKSTAKKSTAKKSTAKKSAAKKSTAKKTATKKTTTEAAPADQPVGDQPVGDQPAGDQPESKAPAKKAAKRTSKKAAASEPDTDQAAAEKTGTPDTGETTAATPTVAPLFKAPDPVEAPARKKESQAEADQGPAKPADEGDRADDSDDETSGRRRRRRGGRRRRKAGDDDGSEAKTGQDKQDKPEKQQDKQQDKQQGDANRTEDGDDSSDGGSGNRRRRRRRRSGEDGDGGGDDSQKTVTRARKPRTAEDEITSLTGSTRLEAKKQRRREGREAGRRRAPIVSEAEFLARREAVDRVMVIRQKDDLTQIAVLEDDVLVEHYVSRESQTSLIGNVYLGRVQNVLPSMEAAFVDIGKGRNAVLYAGEVNWDALGAKDGKPRKIESVLKSAQPVLVQVTKDPVGHKGARLTSQVSLPGRFLVYVPDGTTSGISRKLPDTERNRLKTLLKEIVPDEAGVIVRTAAEGASEEELTRDVERLTARWEDISKKVEKGNAPQLLYGEPDLTLKVVRDLFTEDFAKLVVSGDDAWDMVDAYVEHVAPDLADRLERFEPGDSGKDVFAEYRIDEQIAKGLDRKVWLPSGGSLVIDRTEAMTVIDVNTGKFTGAGGNLEETVTKNNLEAAEEIVRQLRLRDIGGIIVVDFIDMVLESNRDLVLRRMVECLGRDRTRHQVAEVTSLGLVQMTRKRIGTGLLEAFSEPCEHCGGRGLLIHHEPVAPKQKSDEERRGRRGGGRNRGRGGDSGSGEDGSKQTHPSPKDVAAVAKPKEEVSEREPADPEQTEKAEEPAERPQASVPATGSPEVSDVPRETASEAPATEQPATEQPPTEQPAPEQPTAEQPLPEPAAPAEPAPPKVVTGVRRRSAARRPAGPPSSDGAAAGSDGRATSGGATSSNGALLLEQETVPEGSSPETDHAEPQSTAPVHVPVKKKGSRRR